MNNDGGRKTPMQERLNQLGLQFLQRTAREMVSIRESFERAHGGDEAAAEQLRHLVHKIYGTGATLGFASISECAGEIERLLGDKTAAGMAADAQVLERLADGVKRLGNEVEYNVKQHAPQQKSV